MPKNQTHRKSTDTEITIEGKLLSSIELLELSSSLAKIRMACWDLGVESMSYYELPNHYALACDRGIFVVKKDSYNDLAIFYPKHDASTYFTLSIWTRCSKWAVPGDTIFPSSMSVVTQTQLKINNRLFKRIESSPSTDVGDLT